MVHPPQILGTSVVVVQVPLNYVHVLRDDLTDLVLSLGRLGIERELVRIIKLGHLLMAIMSRLDHICLILEAFQYDFMF